LAALPSTARFRAKPALEVDAREELRLPPLRRRPARLRVSSAPESDRGLARHCRPQPPRSLETPPARCALLPLLRRRARSPPRCTQLPASLQL